MSRVYDAIEDHELRPVAHGPEAARRPLKVTMHPGGDPFTDTSIMPTIVSGNTNAAAMAIGWRASEVILSEEKQKRVGGI